MGEGFGVGVCEERGAGGVFKVWGYVLGRLQPIRLLRSLECQVCIPLFKTS